MQKILVVIATMILGTALVSCRAAEPPTNNGAATLPMGYGLRAQVDRAPLTPLGGSASPPPLTNGNAPDRRDETAGPLGWQASPRWAEIRGESCIEVEQDPQNSSQLVEPKRC